MTRKEDRLARRRLLRGFLPHAVDAATDGAELPEELRPPGALAERAFLAACTRCDKCIEACPHGSIFKFTDTAGADLAGTPLMIPDERACHMCEGFPCAAACQDGALVPPATKVVLMGRVAINEQNCIAYTGPECGACVDVCPDALSAIELKNWKPELVAERCVGCGICIESCPTDPAAIFFEPVHDR